jgi:PhzF family phenazine biosynthesis protein
MNDIPFHWVDVFTDKPFRGSPAAVCIIEKELDDEIYLNIAQELNLRETAFPRKIKEGEYKLRWFSPIREVPLCGHATIATAYTLVHEYRETSSIIFHTISGKIEAEINDNKVTLNFPRGATEKEVIPQMIEKLGIKDYVDMRKNVGPLVYMVEVEKPEMVRMLEPDMVGVQKLLWDMDAYFVIVTAKGFGSYDYVYRVFNKMTEDHGCGVANSVVGPYWAEKLCKNELFALQPTARQSEIMVKVLNDGIRLTGSATMLIKGTMTI